MSAAGFLILLMAAALAAIQAVSGTRRAALLTLTTIAAAFALLVYAFITNNAGLQLVLQHSHPSMPLFYKIGAVWGNHEGSMLLLALLLTIPAALIQNHALAAPARQVLGWLTAGVLGFIALAANPFAIADNTVSKGLNPLLQDMALIIHPPILYVGYILSAVPYAYVVSHCIAPGLTDDKTMAKRLRPWLLSAWSFLTIGIALGSWWAYRELGWGGWWFWDPVENVALVPWLLLTASLHSAISTQKLSIFTKWTMTLSVLAFASAVFGMFVTRSGLLVSVHAFASDPTKGVILLLFNLAILLVGLWAVARKPSPASNQPVPFWSRENFVLLNNIALVTAAAIILTATLWPLLQPGISIGAPFYNKAVVPLMLPILGLMALAVLCAWRSQKAPRLNIQRLIIAIVVVLFWLLLAGVLPGNGTAFAALTLLISLGTSLLLLPRRRQLFSVWLAHGGLAITILGMILTTSFAKREIKAMAVGDTITIADGEWGEHTFTFTNVYENAGPNFAYRAAEFTDEDGNSIKTERRIYLSRQMMTSEVGILGHGFSHYYLVQGAVDGTKKRLTGEVPLFTVHVYYHPGIRLIWGGALIMAFGGVVGAGRLMYRQH